MLLAGPPAICWPCCRRRIRSIRRALAEQLGGPVRLANDREIAEVFRDCECGVVPPFGTRYGLSTLLDDAIDPDASIVLETQTQFEAVRLRCRDFEHAGATAPSAFRPRSRFAVDHLNQSLNVAEGERERLRRPHRPRCAAHDPA